MHPLGERDLRRGPLLPLTRRRPIELTTHIVEALRRTSHERSPSQYGDRMLDRANVIRALKHAERADLARRFGLDPRRRCNDELLLALLEQSGASLDELLDALTMTQLVHVARKNRLRISRRRADVLAVLAGHEAERFPEPYATWVRRLERFGRCLDRLDADQVYLRIGPPARESEIRDVETLLGVRLPDELRRTLREFSGDFHFWWSTRARGAPGRLAKVTQGHCSFGARVLKANNCPALSRPPADDEGWHAIYADKLLCFPDTGGDAIAFDGRKRDVLVYLSHEEPLSRPPLARDFDDMMERWTELACAGPGHYIIDLFRGKNGRLDPRGRNATDFRRWLDSAGAP